MALKLIYLSTTAGPRPVRRTGGCRQCGAPGGVDLVMGVPVAAECGLAPKGMSSHRLVTQGRVGTDAPQLAAVSGSWPGGDPRRFRLVTRWLSAGWSATAWG